MKIDARKMGGHCRVKVIDKRHGEGWAFRGLEADGTMPKNTNRGSRRCWRVKRT